MRSEREYRASTPSAMESRHVPFLYISVFTNQSYSSSTEPQCLEFLLDFYYIGLID